MNRTQAVLAAFASAALLLPFSAFSAEEPSRLEALEQRLMALEEKLEASEATIEAQRELLKSQAAPAVNDGTGLDPFLSSVDIGGFITMSYIYNFNQPATNTFSQTLCQFNCNHDEFSFDAAQLSFGKEAANPGDAGFQLDLLFGQNGDISRFLSPTAGGAGVFGDSDFGVFVQEAYVTYNLNGTELKMGNFETLLGWELLDSHLNYNISHGVLFTWAIPLYHTGVMASGSLGENIGWSLGITNGFNNVIDLNDNKGVLGIITFESGPLFTSLSAFSGSETSSAAAIAGAPNPGTTDNLSIFDFVVSFSPSDNLSFWLNADYGIQDDVTVASLGPGAAFDNTDSSYYGAAVGANFAINEKLSFAVRGEAWFDDDDIRGAGGFGGLDGAEVEIYTLTGTLKYQLTDNAYIRGELRWDQADDDVPGVGGKIFPKGDVTDDETVFGIVEVSYVFD